MTRRTLVPDPHPAGLRTLHRSRDRALRWGVPAFAALLLWGCQEEPRALEVGPIGYTMEQLGVLGPGQQRVLADVTGLGLAVAQERVDSLVGPLVARDLRSIVLQQLAMELSADRAGLGDVELRQRYLADPRQELEVRHLVVLSERWRPGQHRDSARARAEEALRKIRGDASFETVAAEYSDEPGARERGGLLDPGREGSWVPEFWAAASSLEEGEVSDVVETEYGFHVLKLEERRPVPFTEIRSEVLRNATNLPAALGEAEVWAARRMAEARVDTAAIRELLGPDTLSSSGSGTVLVTWPEAYGIPPFRARDVEGPLPAAGDGGLRSVLGQAQTHMMVEHAGRVGVGPSETERAAIRKRWLDRVAGWAASLGFEAGQSLERVEVQALQALGAQEQSAAIARTELESIRPRLRALYPVRRPGRSASSAEAVNSDTSG